MKKENQNFENNISRLVKLTAASDKPNKEFTEALTNKVLNELKQPDRKREGRKSTMKRRWVKITGWAAAVLIVCGISFSFINSIFVTEKSGAEKSSSEPTTASDTTTNTHTGGVTITLSNDGNIVTIGYDTNNSEVVRAFSLSGESINGPTLYFTSEPVTNYYVYPGNMSFQFDGSYELAIENGGAALPNNEAYDAMFFKNYGVNPFIDTEDDNLSTFAVDVDTGSYTIARSYLQDGHLPPAEAVRVEEFVNYFDYLYPAPAEDVFSVYMEASAWPFGGERNNNYLFRVGVKGYEISEQERKPAMLTFVIDISGSMSREDRLELVKKSLRVLVDKLRDEDEIGIAVYGSNGRKILDHTPVNDKGEILSAIDSLAPSGSTYAEEGIRIGYEMAEAAYREGFINRVILCSDGVANVGETGADEILKVIKEKADMGITLSTLGFGMGNFNDVLMEQLGDKGNGHYAYIDTIAEARRIFGDNLTGALQVIARDVKIQVEFNPEVVRSYRLIGYENRNIADEDFRNDKVDGGEVGAGHSVTALYELKLWPEKEGNIADTYIRYKDPDSFEAYEIQRSFDTGRLNESFDESSIEFQLAGTVAEFAEILRKSYWAKDASIEQVLEKAQELAEQYYSHPDVIELVDLISKAKTIGESADSDSENSNELPDYYDER